MALLHTISSVVRLPFRVAGHVVGTATSLLPGAKKAAPAAAPAPTDVKATPAPAPTPVARPRRDAPVQKAPSKGPVTPAAEPAQVAEPATRAPKPTEKPAEKAAEKPAPAKKATPTKKAAPAKPAEKSLPKPVVEDPMGEPVTSIDADADPKEFKVTPADIAPVAGKQLEESAESTEAPETE